MLYLILFICRYSYVWISIGRSNPNPDDPRCSFPFFFSFYFLWFPLLTRFFFFFSFPFLWFLYPDGTNCCLFYPLLYSLLCSPQNGIIIIFLYFHFLIILSLYTRLYVSFPSPFSFDVVLFLVVDFSVFTDFDPDSCFLVILVLFVFKFVWMSWSYYPWSPFPWHSPTFPLFFLFTTLISISISIIFLFLIVMYLMFVLYSISSPSSFFFHFVPFICTIHLFVFFKFMDHAHPFYLFIWDSWFLIVEFYCCLCYIFVQSHICTITDCFFFHLFVSIFVNVY